MNDADFDQPSEQQPSDSVAHSAANLNQIEQDLVDVEVALSRLADGTYFTDEVTGEPIVDDVLEQNPLARRAQ